MGQLRATRRKKCFFVVYTKNWIHVEEIAYDNTFWMDKMVEQLKTYYLLFIEYYFFYIFQSKYLPNRYLNDHIFINVASSPDAGNCGLGRMNLIIKLVYIKHVLAALY